MSRWEFAGRSLVRDVFVETGTGEGETVARAAAAGFRVLHTIEVHPGNAALARLRFAADFRVHVHLGSSPAVLPLVLADRPTTIWLDAHYRACGRHEMDPAAGECPLLAELAAVRSVRWTVRPVVVIDDARMFDRPWPEELRRHFDGGQWPTRAGIAAALPGYSVEERDDILYCLPGDV